jgi:hypothetical protein
MRQSILTGILGTILLGAAAGQAHAQYRDRFDGRGAYGNGQNENVVARVMRDVQAAGRDSYTGRRNRDFQRAMDELQRFDERWRRGQWDQGRLDRSIERVSALANSRDVNPRDRRVMFDDANLLRDFRASQGRYRR